MAKKILLAFGALVLAVLIFASTRPDSFTVERSLAIHAPPEPIFSLVNDLHNWAAWSPYDKLDPAMKKTIEGAASGIGAKYAWEGNGQAGAGRMEIQRSTSPSVIDIQLDMVKPFAATNQVEFKFEPQGNATLVTWSMHGPSPYISKLMGLFMNMDKMIGSQFEEGLSNIKAIAERPVPAGDTPAPGSATSK